MEHQREGSFTFTVLVSAGAAALAAVASVALANALQDRRHDRDSYYGGRRSLSVDHGASRRSMSGGNRNAFEEDHHSVRQMSRQISVQQEATMAFLKAGVEDDVDEQNDPVAFLNSTREGARSKARRLAETMRAKEEIIGAMSESVSQMHQTGFSMEDAVLHAQAEKEKAVQMKPKDVVAELQKGNTRFWMGVASRPEQSAFERRALIMSQFPQVAVLGCADSRVPVEIVFDQGLGDLFVVRVAGNCLDKGASASIEYAVVHLNVKVVLVMGHEGCGAVKAAMLPKEQLAKEPEELRTMLMDIKEGLDEKRLDKVLDKRAHDREAVVTNVNHTLAALQQDEAIMSKVRSKDLMLVGAFYEISSGIVDFVKEIDS